MKLMDKQGKRQYESCLESKSVFFFCFLIKGGEVKFASGNSHFNSVLDPTSFAIMISSFHLKEQIL